MNLRVKAFLAIVFVLVVLFSALYAILSRVLIADFLDIEQREAIDHAARVTDALENKTEELSIKLSDWGQWDDTYAFVQDRNQEYIDSNLQDEALQILHINFVIIADNNDQIVFEKHVDSEGKAQPVPESLKGYFSPRSALLSHENVEHAHRGILVLPEGAIILASRTITSSDGTAEPLGTISFAYFIDEDVLEHLSQLTHLSVEFVPYAGASLSADYQKAFHAVSRDQRSFLRIDDEHSLSAFALADDLFGEPALIVKTPLAREVYEKSKGTIAIFFWVMAGVGATVVFVVFLLFEFLVLKKIFRLNWEVGKIREGKDLRMRLSFSGKDEFSKLSDAINQMLSSLQRLEIKKRESEERFQAIADSVPVMIWIADRKGNFTYVNKTWLDFSGRTIESELGSGWKERVHPDDLTEVEKITAETGKNPVPFHAETRQRHKDGTYRWLFVTGIPQFDRRGVFKGYIGSSVDITERKENEEKQQEYIGEIENMNKIMVARELKMIELKEKIQRMQHDG